jgi:hypothetical protein
VAASPLNIINSIFFFFVLDDYFIQITKRRYNDRNVYTIPMKVGAVPTVNIDLVLATNTEWTFITGRNCSDR